MALMEIEGGQHKQGKGFSLLVCRVLSALVSFFTPLGQKGSP
jgi:hypothetical protein